MRWLALLAGLLLAAPAAGQGLFPFPGKPGTYGGGGGSFSSFPNFPEDFEAANTTDCSDDALPDNAESGTVDCGYTTTALAGSESFQYGAGTTNYLRLTDFIDDAGAVLDDNSAQCRFLGQFVTFGSSTALLNFAVFGDGGTTKGGRFLVRSQTSGGNPQGQLAARSQDFSTTNSSSSTISAGTTYKFCLTYDEALDLSTLQVDPAAGTYCAGTTINISNDGGTNGGTASANIDEFWLGSADFGGSANTVFDDVDCGYEP